MKNLIILCPALWIASGALLPCDAELASSRLPVVLDVEGSAGVTVDESDGSLWVTSAISTTIFHLSSDLEVVGRFRPPFEPSPHEGITGIAYNSTEDTLFLVRPVAKEIVEVEKHDLPDDPGVLVPTGRVISLFLDPPPNIIPEPFPKGIAFNPLGDGGFGSIWLVEAVMTKIYEISLEAVPRILNEFCHPDDPDGCPGNGAAAEAGDIGLYWEGGEPVALEILGGVDRRDQIRRVEFDGEPTGVSYPVAAVGGRPGGFFRWRLQDPGSGELKDVFYVTVESSAELHVMNITDPEILPILDLHCEVSDGVVELGWRNTGAYEKISVLRDGETIAALDRQETTYSDASPRDGVLDYELVATRNACQTAASCTVVVGAGEVLEEYYLDAHAVDVTEDSDGLLWVSFSSNDIGVFDGSFTELAFFPGPFLDDDDVTSGIAYNPANRTFFVYNATTQMVAEIDASGELVGDIFPSGEPEEAVVPSMLFNPAGAGGAGSFWYVDVTTAAIRERNRAGELLRSCVHPDYVEEMPPPWKTHVVCGREQGPYLRTYLWGITSVPGSDFQLFDVAGGRARDGASTRILRLDISRCEPTGFEIPLDGVATVRRPYSIGLHRKQHPPALYVVNQRVFAESWFLVVEDRPPAVPPATELRCVQPSALPDVLLTYKADRALDAVEILRDGDPVATVGSDVESFIDQDVPPGFHIYEVYGVRDAERGDERRCSLQVGPGSVSRRSFSFPLSFIHELAYDPVADNYILASNTNSYSNCLYRFNRDLAYLEDAGPIESPFPLPMQIAALAVRVNGGSSEIYCLGWSPGASPGKQEELRLQVIDATGRFLRTFMLPAPPRSNNFVTFPVGMTWDSVTDTLWLLWRNSRTLMNFSPEGDVLSTFSHPAPSHQDGVESFGLAIDGERGALYLASAGPLDYQITKIVEVTRRGEPTGVEIPVGTRYYTKVRGFELEPDGHGIVVSSTKGSVSDLVDYRAFDPLAPVGSLSCEVEPGPGGEGFARARLTWENNAVYDSITVYRRRELAATLPGSSIFWVDEDYAGAPVFYRVVAHRDPFRSAGAICDFADGRPFLRGDVEENGEINLSDAVAILGFLFLGGTAPACLDAADADDSGDLNITDPVSLLTYLFLSGVPPRVPFPLPGYDPTADGLECSE